jgi:Rps23 Pro-64 3,4-dihydroxylase Tpa1-like proline 4-hydroxylase
MSNVKIVHNALSLTLLEVIQDYVKHGQIRHSYMDWSAEVIKASNPVLIKDLNDNLSNRIISELKLHLPEHTEIKCMWYGWIRGSYIPWHSDNNVKFGATLYLNNYWDENWGGYFAYKEADEIKCIKPDFNKLTIIKPPVDHTVFNTTSNAPIRETIQIFGR